MKDTPQNDPATDANDTVGEFDVSEGTANAVRTLVAETTDAVAGAEEFDIGEIFEALSQPGRRYVLTYLLQSAGHVSCSELVDYVVEQTEVGMTEEQFRRRVVTELTHSDLPKLEEYGLIKYNMERQIVGPTDLTPIVRPYIRLALAQQHVADRTEE